MAERKAPGLLAIFAELDTTIEAIGRLRRAGHKRLVVFSPLPRHELEDALEPPHSSVRVFTLVGGLTGAATGFAFPIFTKMDWPLVTGAQPMYSLPAFVIIAFELTILFGALATVLGLFINARLPRARPEVVYDASFSEGRFGIYLEPGGDRVEAVRTMLREAGAAEVRDRPQEVDVGTL